MPTENKVVKTNKRVYAHDFSIYESEYGCRYHHRECVNGNECEYARGCGQYFHGSARGYEYARAHVNAEFQMYPSP